ncbi:MAG TPA: hypothetical protein PK079_22385 [Leptospiraceae bacterium]|nr:hypothetical protein [Leptospiraceae bacterium]HMX34872.1 hypothetical protein [Leptospiraceae bacterium]HMY34222.1 hypothetical protein [Leptospiraceae bacterium]HMZ66526.1 hypothetical protein [Leptospiraceae bacterium]HNA10281.1 hypothetical protein [Leptospiraceae bacterium]
MQLIQSSLETPKNKNPRKMDFFKLESKELSALKLLSSKQTAMKL